MIMEYNDPMLTLSGTDYTITMPESGGVIVYNDNDGMPMWQFVLKDGTIAYFDLNGNPIVP